MNDNKRWDLFGGIFLILVGIISYFPLNQLEVKGGVQSGPRIVLMVFDIFRKIGISGALGVLITFVLLGVICIFSFIKKLSKR